jgi:hypothetical protein
MGGKVILVPYGQRQRNEDERARAQSAFGDGLKSQNIESDESKLIGQSRTKKLSSKIQLNAN